VTINNNAGPFWSGTWNENNLNPLSRINWRASLVPAAAKQLEMDGKKETTTNQPATNGTTNTQTYVPQ